MTHLQAPSIDPSLCAIILATHPGAGLYELTSRAGLASLPFGAARVVDFAVAAVTAAGAGRIVVLTQTGDAGAMLAEYLHGVWGSRLGGRLQVGSDPAVVLAMLRQDNGSDVLLAQADTVSGFSALGLVAAHRRSGAGLTLAATAAPAQVGLRRLCPGPEGRITTCLTPAAAPVQALASLGLAVAKRDWLLAQPGLDAAGINATDPHHALRRHLLPLAIAADEARMVDMGPGFAHAIDTLDAYRAAALAYEATAPRDILAHDILAVMPPALWPSPTTTTGTAMRLEGVTVVSPRLNPQDPARWTLFDGSVLMKGARVGAGVRLTKTLVAPGTSIPAGMVIGEDDAEDATWFRITEGGTRLVTTSMIARRAVTTAFGRPAVGQTNVVG